MSLSVPQLQQYATTFAQQNGVPAELFLTQIGQESSWNVNARNGNAFGIAQFMPGTAAELGVSAGTSDQAVLSQLQGAAQYDAQLYSKTGSWVGAMRSYGTLPQNANTSLLSPGQNKVLTAALNADSPGSGAQQYGTSAAPFAERGISQPKSNQSLSEWIKEKIGDVSLIGFGAVIAIIALVYSQRDNIKVAVSTAGKVAEKGAIGAFLA